MTVRQLFAKLLRRGIGPLLPTTQQLPFRYKMACLDGVEPELRLLHRLGPNRGTAVDVGANEGLFTYRLSQLYDRVVAFEINEQLIGFIQAYQSREGKVEVHGVGLSSAEGDAYLYVPIINGHTLPGWASLRPGNLPEAQTHLKLSVRIRTLDSFNLENVTFLKADVEGHELEVLAGAQETIRRNRPIVLVEVKESNLPMVQAFFRELRYSERRVEELIGETGSTENHIFIPAPS